MVVFYDGSRQIFVLYLKILPKFEKHKFINSYSRVKSLKKMDLGVNEFEGTGYFLKGPEGLLKIGS